MEAAKKINSLFFIKDLFLESINMNPFPEWCSPGQYVCANARQCVEQARVCDGTPDCPLGDDEKSCVALADDLDDNEVVPYSEEGEERTTS